MKKAVYEKPFAEKVEFDYKEQIVVASPYIGLYWTDDPGTACKWEDGQPENAIYTGSNNSL